MLLKWQAKKLGFQGLRDLLNSGMKKAFETFYQTTMLLDKKRESVGRILEKLEMASS